MIDISVIICTRNRADSLQLTLETLLSADHTAIDFEVIVVDNESSDGTQYVADMFRSKMHIRYLKEPFTGSFGKAACLNRALAMGSFGPIIAVIDDDISVDKGWFQGIQAICRRWPGFEFFTGPSRIDLDSLSLPKWILDRRIKGWILSVVDHGRQDIPLRDGGSFSGNFFWFRSSILQKGLRFEEVWYSEPIFYNLLLNLGGKGIYGPDASVTHRIQNHLLDPCSAFERAGKVGRSVAQMRLRPYCRQIHAAYQSHLHPVLSRCFCLGHWIQWGVVFLCSFFGSTESCIRLRILSLEGLAYYSELLHLCNSMEEYRIFSKSKKLSKRDFS